MGLTHALGLELARYGINVNCIAPGPILTTLVGTERDKRPQEVKEAFLGSTGFGRLGKPEEVAAAAVFLASDSASFITGQLLNVCGLRTLGRF